MYKENDSIPVKKKEGSYTYQVGGFWIIWLVIIFIIILALLWLFVGGKEQNFIGMKPFMPGVKRPSDVMDKDTMDILGIPDRTYTSIMRERNMAPTPIMSTRIDNNSMPATPAITPILSSRVRASTAQPIISERINKINYGSNSVRSHSFRVPSKRVDAVSSPIPVVISTRLVTERLAVNLGDWESKKTKKESKGEGICRQFLQQHYRQYFPKIRPDFLINPSTGRNLELDGYNSQLRIAFEYNGIQHYKYPNYFHKTENVFTQQVQRDIYKREACDAAGVYLITIPYTVPHDQISNYIRNLLPENRVES